MAQVAARNGEQSWNKELVALLQTGSSRGLGGATPVPGKQLSHRTSHSACPGWTPDTPAMQYCKML